MVTSPQVITFEQVFTDKHVLEAYKHVRKGKKKRDKNVRYHLERLRKLKKLYDSVKNETYKVGKLSKFTVWEPKEREVVADLFEDKIVQDLLSKYVLRPLIGPKLIYDNYASQPDKGTHVALHRLERYSRIFAKQTNWTGDGWVMMGDISKFFYTIDHDTIWQLIDDLPIDHKLKRVIKDIIDICNADINPYSDTNDKGLCIGFQISQWLAVYYLDKLDHFIKETLHIKCYGRYMDDFYLIHEDREYLEECFAKIKEFVENELHVKLNHKAYIHPFKQGICFLGYHVTYDPNTHQVVTKIRAKSVNKMLHRTKIQAERVRDGRMDQEEAHQSLQSWHAYAIHGETEKSKNAYNYAQKMLHMIYDPCEAYRELCDDWTNIDKDGYFILHPKQGNSANDCIRDVDGYAILIRRKKTKKDDWREKRKLDMMTNPEKYVQMNLRAILGEPPRKKKKKSKRDLTKRALSDTLNTLYE
ncbi:MAG: RNA-directed DNA polymerase [Muribaculaceae bacterium]|nr:RNA-directed DNA polymerase [Muribaculaceae bacterium]